MVPPSVSSSVEPSPNSRPDDGPCSSTAPIVLIAAVAVLRVIKESKGRSSRARLRPARCRHRHRRDSSSSSTDSPWRPPTVGEHRSPWPCWSVRRRCCSFVVIEGAPRIRCSVAGRPRPEPRRSYLASFSSASHVRHLPPPHLLLPGDRPPLGLKTGFAFLPFSGGIILGAALASRVLPKHGPRVLMVGGLLRGRRAHLVHPARAGSTSPPTSSRPRSWSASAWASPSSP